MMRPFELADPYNYHLLHSSSSSLFTSAFKPLPFFPHEIDDEVDFALDLLTRKPDQFINPVTDLIRVERTPSSYSYKRLLLPPRSVSDLWLEQLSDRVSALEANFDQIVNGCYSSSKVDRKYTWTAEIKGEPERKYKWTAEIKGLESGDVVGKMKKKKREEEVERKYKWTAEIEGKGDRAARKYTIEVESGGDGGFDLKKKAEEKKNGKKERSATRIVEIEDPSPDHGALVLRQVFNNSVWIRR